MGGNHSTPANSVAPPRLPTLEQPKDLKKKEKKDHKRTTKHSGEPEWDVACNDHMNICCQYFYIPICCCVPGPVDDDEKLNREYRSCQLSCCCCSCETDEVVQHSKSQQVNAKKKSK